MNLQTKEILQGDQNVPNIAAPVTVVGDIHGQFVSHPSFARVHRFGLAMVRSSQAWLCCDARPDVASMCFRKMCDKFNLHVCAFPLYGTCMLAWDGTRFRIV
jgi:hypothetical protein